MIIYAKVKPSSNEDKIEKVSENNYIIKIKEKAVKNKANIKLIKLISKHLNVSQKSITIKNPNSRDKIIEVKDEIHRGAGFTTKDD